MIPQHGDVLSSRRDGIRTPAFVVTAALLVITQVAPRDAPAAERERWVRTATFLADDRGFEDRIGESVAVDQGTIVIGAPQDSTSVTRSGSVFVVDAVSNAQIMKLVSPEPQQSARFGEAVGIAGTRIVVGAPGTLGGVVYKIGAAHLFDATTGEHIAVLRPTDTRRDFHFGHSVAANTQSVFVGMPGDGRLDPVDGAVFKYDASSGEAIARWSIEGVKELGLAVAANDSLVLASGVKRRTSGPNAWFVHVLDIDTGDILAVLDAPGTDYSDAFGSSIDVDGGLAVIGAPDSLIAPDSPGSAWLFDLGTGEHLRTFVPTSGHIGDAFGSSVAIADGCVLVGAPGRGAGGVAFVFDQATSEQLIAFASPDRERSSAFGAAVGAQRGLAVITDPALDERAPAVGAAYIYQPDFQLQFIGNCPGLIWLCVSSQASDAPVYFFVADQFDPGAGPRLPRCLGVTLDLINPELIAVADPEDGSACVLRPVSSDLCGNVYIQAAQRADGCRVSNVIRVE